MRVIDSTDVVVIGRDQAARTSPPARRRPVESSASRPNWSAASARTGAASDQDDDPAASACSPRRGASTAGRHRGGHSRLRARRRADPGRGHRQLGRHRRGGADRRAGRHARARPGARRPGHRRGRRARRRRRVVRAARASSSHRRRRPVPPIEGLADTPYWTNREVVETETLPASLIVLGGGAIGVELAQAFARFGVARHRRRGRRPADRAGGARVECADRRRPARRGLRHPQVGASPWRRAHDGTFTLVVDGDTSAPTELLVAAGRTVDLESMGVAAIGVDARREVAHRRRTAPRARPAPRGPSATDRPGAFTHVASTRRSSSRPLRRRRAPGRRLLRAPPRHVHRPRDRLRRPVRGAGAREQGSPSGRLRSPRWPPRMDPQGRQRRLHQGRSRTPTARARRRHEHRPRRR